MSDTMSRTRDRRAAHLRTLRDHPSTSPEERAAAIEALQRLGSDPERPRFPWETATGDPIPDRRPWDQPKGDPEPEPDLSRWRSQMEMDVRILDTQTLIAQAARDIESRREEYEHMRWLLSKREEELEKLRVQLDHQCAWRKAMG